MKIKLQQVVDAIEQADDALVGFWDSETGENIWLSDELYSGETNEKLAEEIENSVGRYYRLPTKYEIHKYSIMESFVGYLPNGKIKAELSAAIHGKGAFRRFKQGLRYHGMEQLWYDYQAESFQEKAIRWCRDNELEYEE